MGTETETPLRIHRLQAENVKRIKVIDITPDGEVIKLTGKNKQGKTSTLDSIWLGIGGGKAKRDTAVTNPIRHGETQASVMIDLGDLTVTRKWELGEDGETTTELFLANKDGVPRRSPQAALDALINHAGFDPLSFTRLDDKSQVAALLELVDLPFDPIEFDEKTKDIEAQRTVFDRGLKELKAQVAAMPRYPNAPAERVESTLLLDEIRNLQTTQTARAEKQGEYERAQDAKSAAEWRVSQLEAQLETARGDATRAGVSLEAAKKEYEGLPDSTAMIAELQESLATAGETNSEIEANERFEHATKDLLAKTAESEGRTTTIEARRQEKRDALAAAKFPVDGLSFEDGVVMYDGQPFAQASAAEQTQISMALVMAGNPTLRVITIRDASLLDSESMKIITDMAAEHGFQIWLEIVDESGEVGVVIEDGSNVR